MRSKVKGPPDPLSLPILRLDGLGAVKPFGLNHVELIGDLGADVTVNYFISGGYVANQSVASNERVPARHVEGLHHALRRVRDGPG